MSASKSRKATTTTTNTKGNDQFVDVLYQKLGDNWFAFSLIDDEVFMSPVSDDKINEIRTEGGASNVNRSSSEIDNEAA